MINRPYERVVNKAVRYRFVIRHGITEGVRMTWVVNTKQ